MKKLYGQILCIIALLAVFVIFDVTIYRVFTKRCMSDYSEGMQAKSVELDEYLPFEEESKIVKKKSAI